MKLILSKLNVIIKPADRDSAEDPKVIAEITFVPSYPDSPIYGNENAIRDCIWRVLDSHDYEVKIPKTEAELLQEKVDQLEKRVAELEGMLPVSVSVEELQKRQQQANEYPERDWFDSAKNPDEV